VVCPIAGLKPCRGLGSAPQPAGPGQRNHLRHEGGRETQFTNQRGPWLVWHAMFPGSLETLVVNGRPTKALQGKAPLGRDTSSVHVIVAPGVTVSVELPRRASARSADMAALPSSRMTAHIETLYYDDLHHGRLWAWR
jgi:hypothetical protein